MDIGTHLLVGLTLARTGAGKATPYATPALLLAAVLPGLEIVHLLAGPASYVAHSGGWGHSVLGVAGLGLLSAAGFWRAARKKGVPGLFPKLLFVSLLGTGSHVLLDWTTSAGIRLLYPFKQTSFQLDWLPVTDLLLLVILLAALLLPALFRLISDEIGAARTDSGLRWGAWLGLAGCLLLIGVRATQHASALQQLEVRQYRGGPSMREGAFPTPVSPLRWRGVVDTGNALEIVEVNLLGPRLDSLGSHFKPASHPALDAARETPTVRLFLRRARFPHARVVRSRAGWRVEMEDLRFAGGAGAGTDLAVRIEVDGENKIVEERLRWGRFGAWVE